MEEDFKRHVNYVCGVVFLLVLFVFCLGIPTAYIEGTTKAKFIKQMKGIDLSWYEAVNLSVSIDGDVTFKNDPLKSFTAEESEEWLQYYEDTPDNRRKWAKAGTPMK